MAFKNERQYTDFHSGINLQSRNGALRFDTPSTAPSTTSGERLLYVNSSNQFVLDNGVGALLFGSASAGSDAITVPGGNITVSSGGYQAAALSVTANTAGSAVPDGATFVNVTGFTNGADSIVLLPTPTPGNILYLFNASTGYELRSNSAASVSINGGTGAAAESAIPADSLVRAVCVSATAWVCNYLDSAGNETAVEVAA